VSQPTHNPAADPAATAHALRCAARYLARYGWCQGAYYDQTTRVFTPAACMLGAVSMVCYAWPFAARSLRYDDPNWGVFDTTVSYLDEYLTGWCGLNSYEFNDTRGRRAAEVITALEAAADAAGQKHADYPHEPGTLYDCLVCETTCFCADGYTCVRCALAGGAG